MSSQVPTPVHVAVALDGAGWHPAAWREPDARPRELFSPGYWVDLVRESESGLLDFVTIEDSLAIQSTRRGIPDGATDHVARTPRRRPYGGPGRSQHVGHRHRSGHHHHAYRAVPCLQVHRHPRLHKPRSGGSAGPRVCDCARGATVRRRVVAEPTPTGLGASRDEDSLGELFDEAADFLDVSRRLWDSWKDDAEIRDVATGRFVDRDKLHYIDFEGRWFAVKGPSITPRPPQGHPVVMVLAHVPAAFRLAARSADMVFTTPKHTDSARSIVDTVRACEANAPRAGQPLQVFADLVVFLDDDETKAARRKERLDERLGRPFRSDALIFVGTPFDLVLQMMEWQSAGIDGFRLRPGAIPHDLEAITHEVVGALQDQSRFHDHYADVTLRARLGLPRPASRYALA